MRPALEESVVKDDKAAFSKAVEMVHGKPRQTVDQDFTGPIEIRIEGHGGGWRAPEDSNL